MRFRLLPTDDAFFALFDDSAENVAVCAHRLRDLLADPTVAAAHERVLRVFTITGLDQLLEIHPDLEGAVAAAGANTQPH